ncbi:hypothetical protein [Pinibacter aurantiacus]|uniref:GLPGLI family protein n=1 Tax=Pinibacter aurantiacus TaxID=2851599 RepID=A0A9E2SDH6_9BACT|nr:hypothetical protein [Pinibacter aurantiacus]MBV4359293.1 hypothetical protein [Pinibacter aurantiacus]
MRCVIFLLFLFCASFNAFAQSRSIAGSYASGPGSEICKLILSEDSTFSYSAPEYPMFYRLEKFEEKGHWILSGDTVVLNPLLALKPFVESELKEEKVNSDSVILTFRHIKRLIDANGNIVREDTEHINRLDFSFNNQAKKNRVRVTADRTVRCTFAGYIPKEIITGQTTIVLPRLVNKIECIYFGCWELQGMKKFVVADSSSNHYTFAVYSNYYVDGQLRQTKFLVKNENVLYTKRNSKGEFIKDNAWSGAAPGRLVRLGEKDMASGK